MYVKTNIKGTTYKKLMEYAFQKCDVISVNYYYDQRRQKDKSIIDYLLKSENATVKDFVNKYSTNFTSKMYEKYKNDSNIFDCDYIKDYEIKKNNISDAVFERRNREGRKAKIYGILSQIYYDNVIALWVERYQKDIIYQKQSFLDNYPHNEQIAYMNTYYLKITEELKQAVLNRKSLYEWNWPYSIEDICFYRNGIIWLFTSAFEKECHIYCENEKEYQYLRSIGISFYDRKFVPLQQMDIKYADYMNQE